MSNGSPRSLRAHRIVFVLLSVILFGTYSDPAPASNACLDPGRGIGGTGRAAEGSGVGGTGAPVSRGDTERGTSSRPAPGVGVSDIAAEGGGLGGTGIIGTITGFASICVNAVEIHYGADTPVEINGQSDQVTNLAVGQVVAVEAVGSGAEVAARHIAVLHAVSGPLSRIDMDHGEAEVLGQKIELTNRTVIASRSPSIGDERNLRPGDFVQISGLRRRDGTIVSSRVERAPPRAEVSVSGPVTEIEQGAFRIFGLHVEPTAGILPSDIGIGRTVRASGTIDGSRLRTERLRVEPRVPFGGRVERLELQGFIHDRPDENTFVIDGLRVEVSRETHIRDGDASELVSDRRVQVRGRLTPDQRVFAERIDFERRDHHLDDRRGREHRGRSNDHRGRDRDSGGDRSDRSGPSRTDRDDRIDRSGPNRGSDNERPDRYERRDRYDLDRHDRLDRSGPH